MRLLCAGFAKFVWP